MPLLLLKLLFWFLIGGLGEDWPRVWFGAKLIRLFLRKGCCLDTKTSFEDLNWFGDTRFWFTLSKLVGDSFGGLTRLLLIVFILFFLSISETGVVAASQSFPPNELFKLMLATSVSLQVLELLELELVLIVFGC